GPFDVDDTTEAVEDGPHGRAIGGSHVGRKRSVLKRVDGAVRLGSLRGTAATVEAPQRGARVGRRHCGLRLGGVKALDGLRGSAACIALGPTRNYVSGRFLGREPIRYTREQRLRQTVRNARRSAPLWVSEGRIDDEIVDGPVEFVRNGFRTCP